MLLCGRLMSAMDLLSQVSFVDPLFPKFVFLQVSILQAEGRGEGESSLYEGRNQIHQNLVLRY